MKNNFITVSSRRNMSIEWDGCPFWIPHIVTIADWEFPRGCKLVDIPCRFGLTDTKAPKDCPLRTGAVVVKLGRR